MQQEPTTSPPGSIGPDSAPSSIGPARTGPDDVGGAADLATVLPDGRGRGSVDYMLRTLQQNQMQLTILADHKAGIVLTVTLLMVTFAVSRLSEHAVHPAIAILLGGSLLAALLAILSLLPNLANCRIPEGGKGAPDPLFFGHIATLERETYLRRLAEVMRADAAVYTAIGSDVHAIAQVLRRKYRWLRYSYLALLATLLASAAMVLALLVRV